MWDFQDGKAATLDFYFPPKHVHVKCTGCISHSFYIGNFVVQLHLCGNLIDQKKINIQSNNI